MTASPKQCILHEIQKEWKASNTRKKTTPSLYSFTISVKLYHTSRNGSTSKTLRAACPSWSLILASCHRRNVAIVAGVRNVETLVDGKDGRASAQHVDNTWTILHPWKLTWTLEIKTSTKHQTWWFHVGFHGGVNAEIYSDYIPTSYFKRGWKGWLISSTLLGTIHQRYLSGRFARMRGPEGGLSFLLKKLLQNISILLMEEIPNNHLGCIKPRK